MNHCHPLTVLWAFWTDTRQPGMYAPAPIYKREMRKASVGGLIFFGVALLYLALTGPVAASWFAEVVERWGRMPKPSWLRLARRLPFALTASGGIMYSGWMVMFRRPDLQPLWPFNVIVAAIGTLVAVYLAARIRPSSRETKAV